MKNISCTENNFARWRCEARAHFRAFDGLASGQVLVIVNDHDPRRLREQFGPLDELELSEIRRVIGGGESGIGARTCEEA